jgi:catechol 2,3-dioxygenase-like lactoylglutathione lyase family enzyme
MSLDYVPELTASIAVKNLDAAIDWYQKVLGFTFLYRVDEIGWCDETVPQGGGATNVFGVKDIAAAKAHLDAHGVRQDGDIQVMEGMVKLITFFDPDGNAMMLSENLMNP